MKHDLVGSFKNLMNAQVTQEPLDRVVLQITVAAMHLQGIVDDVEALVGRELLGHGTLHRIIRLEVVETICAVANHQPTRLEVRRHFCELELNVLVGGKRLAELLPLLHVVCRNIEALGGTAERARGDVKSAAVEPG